MEIFPRGFILGHNYGNVTKNFKIKFKNENEDISQATIKLGNGVLKLANNLKHADNLSFIVKKLYSRKALEFAMYDMNYKMHFLTKDKRMCRLDLEYASFLGSIGEVVGLYVDTRKVNSLLLFMPKSLEFSDKQIENLDFFKEMIEEIDMVETMLCCENYKDNIQLSKEQTILLFENILNSNRKENNENKKRN